MIRTHIVSYILLVFLVLIGCSEQVIAYGSYGLEYKGVITPHSVWGKPWNKGVIKALIFVSGVPLGGKANSEYTKPGFSERDAIELLQRFDIAIDTVMMCSPTSGFTVPGKQSYERLKRLVKCNRYDVIVLGNVSFDSLNPEIKYHILRQVKEGAGLVCVGFKPKNIFLHRNRMPVPRRLVRLTGVQYSPFFRSLRTGESEIVSRIINVYRLGNSRGVYVHYPVKPIALSPELIYSKENAALYEYWCAWIGKVILWSADKLSDIELKDDGLPDEAVLILNKGRDDVTLTVNVNYKNIRGEEVFSEARNVELKPKATLKFSLSLADVPNGRYYAELIVKDDDGKVETFGCKVLERTRSPKILSARSDGMFVETGEKITVRIRSEYVKKGKIRTELVDANSRTIFRRETDISKTRKFSNNIVGLTEIINMRNSLAVTSAMRIRVSLLKGDTIYDSKDIKIAVTHRNQNGFKFVVWGERPDVLSYYAFKRLAEHFGLKGAISWVPEPLAANNISQVAYVTKIVPPSKHNGRYVPFSWADNAAIDDYLSKKLNRPVWRKARGYGVMVWSLGDEPATSSVDDSSAYRRAYREYLRKRYGTIANLNRIWKSTYSDFSEIDVLDKNDLKEEIAKRKKLYARWYDRQYFMSRVFTNVFSRFKPMVLKLDSKAKIGFEGAGELGKNPDIAGLVKVNDFWVTYNNIAFDIIRGLTGRGFICSKWMGYHKDGGHLISYAWDTIFRGADSLWWWRFDGIGRYNGLIKSNLEFWPQASKLMNSIKIMNEGLGDWLMSSQRGNDGVAIYYSHVSAAASRCENNPSLGSYASGHNAFVEILRNLGIGFRYITPEMIKHGQLSEKDVKILLLVKAYAIDNDTADRIKRFVAQGGMVIADVMPGTFDGYCQPRKKSVLSELFNRRWIAKHRISHKRVILLNRTIDDYVANKTTLAGEKLRRLFDCYFKAANLKLIRLKLDGDKSFKRRGDIYITRWRAGDSEIIGVLNLSSGTVSSIISFDRNYFVYGISPARKGINSRYVRVNLQPQKPIFIAVSNSEISMPHINYPKQIVSGQEVTVKFTDFSKDEKQALFVWLEKPDSSVANWSKRTVLVSNGQAEYKWRVAFEDINGQWKLHIRQLIGGEEFTAQITKIPYSH